MFVTMNSVVMVVIALSIVMIAYGVIINIEAIVHKKAMNPRAMFIIMAILAISTIVLICNIDYSKSAPAEIFTNEDVTGAYNAGYDKGVEEAYATTEDWFSNLQNVTISEDNSTIHLIDNNGEEWVLVSDDYQN
jgi:hypothetical protein|uniref:Uncharacterized protein n=2 Tax=unclassified Caudoviricetes TaxID=2788787 RepID=A0A8S5PHW7_9CAUD|nr:MAG TPA: hypothetical protein [Siphoviridae sp. ctJcm18]DAE06670.1 MAG TPA: hypothetical protein [Siphoviridae sp. ctUGQ45]